MPTLGQAYGVGGKYATSSGFLASIEAEIEAVGGDNPGMVGNWSGKADNSLRNHGIEYISVHARSRAQLLEDVAQLYATLQFRKGEEPFSERTSTHVHINVSNCEVEHVRNMVLLYALFEEFFFRMVKPERRDNIHCVALTDTFLPQHYKETLDGLYHRWHKYTALNMKRLCDLGTLEFRHLHGTKDQGEIGRWLHVLENLWKLGQRVTIDKKSIMCKETVGTWFDTLFFPDDNIMAMKPMLFNIIRNSLIDTKLSISEGK